MMKITKKNWKVKSEKIKKLIMIKLKYIYHWVKLVEDRIYRKCKYEKVKEN